MKRCAERHAGRATSVLSPPGHCRRWVVLGALLLVKGVFAQAPPLVVESDPQSPADQQARFHLPPGFEIQLVASEPDIGQPMNLNFDADGRLWVTHSLEYPYPVAGEGVEPRSERLGPLGEGPPRDRLTILSDIDETGRAGEVIHFAEGLNIPIGHTPIPGGAIFHSIPHLWISGEVPGETTRAREILYGPFGNVDTHGMVNSLTRWIDGWVYACHGYANTSRVRGRDGHEVTMHSGNTFRFREDGSRIEQYTWGQVNPFGLAFDSLGNLFTADCHSMPVTCLIRGAYYSSFGKPHDGLGFGPDMIDHNHGSTGICGVAVYEASHFPEEYGGNLFICNPVTGRVHRDRLRWNGASPMVESQPDFVSCDDGWFRPVDVQLGPDGALYIADFYNCIIGHYEVALDHPKRDRTHGRIWRVVWRGQSDTNSPADKQTAEITLSDAPRLSEVSQDDLIERLGDPNLCIRTLATNALFDRFGASAANSLQEVLRSTSSPDRRVAALWVLGRLGSLSADDIRRLSKDPSRRVRVHLARYLAELSDWEADIPQTMQVLLNDDDAFVRRAAADAWGLHADAANLRDLLRVLPPPESLDTHLRHTVRIALRNRLAGSSDLKELRLVDFTEAERRELASICLGVPSDASARFLTEFLRTTELPQDEVSLCVTHIGRHGTQATLDMAARLLREQSGEDWIRQYRLIEALQLGLPPQQRAVAGQLKDWATDVARHLLQRVPAEQRRWSELPAPGVSGPLLAWPIQPQPRVAHADGLFFGGRPQGEQGVGVLRSEPFLLPEVLMFWLAGHDGFPDRPPSGRNRVALRAAGTGVALAEAAVPRQDAAVRVEWKLPEHAGESVYLEVVDGISGSAYAWIAAGEFSVESLNPISDLPAPIAGQLIAAFQLESLQPELDRLAADDSLSVADRAELWRAQLALRPDARLGALLSLAIESTIDRSVRDAIGDQFVRRDAAAIEELLKRSLQVATQSQQLQIADSLCGSREGAEGLLDLVGAGVASARLLTVPVIRQKLEAIDDGHFRNRVAELTASLPPEDERLAELITARRRNVQLSSASIDRGKALFAKHCGVCHQVGGEGKKVGPQLDGVGIRGVDRLLEDLLDPNRNVDIAFRTIAVLMDDGRVITGLPRREEPGILVLADNKGEEVRIALDDIEAQQPSALSLMPENLVESLPQPELNDLLAYLLAQGAKSTEHGAGSTE